MAENFDDMFKEYASSKEAESNRPGFTPKNYETLEWTGLEIGKPKVIRVVGGPPDSNLEPSTARVVTIAWVVGDDGKRFRVIRPSINTDPTYILNRIISKVNTVRWSNNTKTHPVKDAHPDIFNIIEKNGLDASDPRAKFERGWKGKEVLIANVIDRSKMDWHRNNKHTMLLAKSVIEATNGGTYVDEGISSYAISQRLNLLFKSYGSWEKYDIAITRTGKMDNPYTIVNATRVPEEVDPSVADIISQETSLSEEEKSWERYDLEKLFRITTATKIFNRLKGTIKKIDAALGTSYLEEIQDLVEKEKKYFEELYGDENEAEREDSRSNSGEPAEEKISKPIVSATSKTREIRTQLNESKKEAWQDLPFGDTLSPEMKAKVLSVTKDTSGKVTDITWDAKPEDLAACPDCNTAAPLDVTTCPVCGLKF